MNLKIKMLDDELPMPSFAHDGDAGLDVRTRVDAVIPPNGVNKIPLGFACEIPAGYVGLLFPRSGMAAKYGLTFANAVGVIDSGYRGEVCALVTNLSHTDMLIHRGDRIGQLVAVPFLAQEPLQVDELDGTERGADGFGSTGVE